MSDLELDMTMMFAIHDALRRDLAAVATMRTRTEGWDLFERMLDRHHTIEDDSLWPVVREAVAGEPDNLALLDDMATEHAAIGPLLAAVDAALAHGDSASQARADLDEKLRGHLTHEEEAAVPLINDALTEEQWIAFGKTSAEQIGPDMPRFLPWVLDGADDDRTAAVLAVMPEPVQQAYRTEWLPAYTGSRSLGSKTNRTKQQRT